MSILITRPSPHGERLVNKLLFLDRLAYHFPLIYFSIGRSLSLLQQKLRVLSEGDLLFIMSGYAVLYAHYQLLNVGVSWPTKLMYYSVGQATSVKMYCLSGILVRYSNVQETSEGLLKLPELINIYGERRALILQGNYGRSILKNTLQKRGVCVNCCECYNRNFFSYDGVEQYYRMLHWNISTIVITCKSVLMQLYYLFPKCYRVGWLVHCRLIVVSTRIAVCAKNLGWTDIIVSYSANDDVLIAMLLKYAQ